MNLKILKYIPFVCLLVISCNNGPKVIETGSSNSAGQEQYKTGIFTGNSEKASVNDDATRNSSFTSNVHQVLVKETLPTSKYVYLLVNEGDEEYWVATRKQDVEVGARYYFKDGLLKTNFESKEYNRIFEKIYLVSNLVPVEHSHSVSQSKAGEKADKEAEQVQTKPVKWPVNPEVQKASMKISDLVSDMKKYEGKEVQLTGECVKVNPNIMGRNWIHLKDGTMDEYDLVVTSNVSIPEGHVVTLKGTVALGKDFGAGYSYEILVENAELVR